jgi:type I restriction enzyme S subunit
MSVPAYESYQPTDLQWLGDLPSHWRTPPFWSLFRRTKRVGHPEAELLSVYRDYGVIRKSDRDDNFNNASDDLGTYQLVEPGDLAVNKMKAWQGSLGISQLRGIVSPAYFVFESRHRENPHFLHHLLRSAPFAAAFMMISKGVRPNQWDVDPDHLNQLPVPLPSLEEQSAIAAFLDRETGKIDALVEEQRQLIGLLKEKRQAVVSHAVTKGLDPSAPMKALGLDWPAEVPAHWEVLPLTRLVGQFVDYRGATPTKVADGVPLITAAQIKNGRLDHSLDPAFISEAEYATRMTRGYPARGDLLLTTEAPLGEAALIEDERVAPGQRMILMKVKDHKVSTNFLLQHFRSIFGQKELWTRASGSTASGIRSDRLRASQVLVPPLHEQRAICAHIDHVTAEFDAIDAAATKQIALLQERRAALISAAVTGKIDVRGHVAAEAEAA